MHFPSFSFKNIFHSAILKLTVFYVLIIMAISIAFSLAIYDISSNEINRGLGKQVRILRDIPLPKCADGSCQAPDFEQIRTQQLDESNNRLRNNLIYFNLLILLLSAGLSYILARLTLQPIEESMESQNRFSADASHELRTPLTAMKSEIEVFLRDKNSKINEAKTLLSSNLEEIEKLESLSSALLKMARYQDIDKNQIFECVSLQDTLVAAYEKVEALAKKKTIKFQNELERVNICGDRESLIELFVILLDNAIKYSPTKSAIRIIMKKDKKWAMVSIKDEGAGIKASDLPHIFDRFYRADLSRSKEKVDGYGLGLSIAKRIVEEHGAKISVNSKPDQGTEFVLKFAL